MRHSLTQWYIHTQAQAAYVFESVGGWVELWNDGNALAVDGDGNCKQQMQLNRKAQVKQHRGEKFVTCTHTHTHTHARTHVHTHTHTHVHAHARTP